MVAWACQFALEWPAQYSNFQVEALKLFFIKLLQTLFNMLIRYINDVMDVNFPYGLNVRYVEIANVYKDVCLDKGSQEDKHFRIEERVYSQIS